MNKTKSFLAVASISLALTLTFSCSSDDGGGTGNATISCKTDNACVTVSAEACLELGGTKVNSCKATQPSSSSGGNNPGCKYYGGSICMEFIIDKEVSALKDDCEDEDGEFFEGSCPSGYVKKCDEDKDGPAYFYGSTYQGLTCQQIWDML